VAAVYGARAGDPACHLVHEAEADVALPDGFSESVAHAFEDHSARTSAVSSAVSEHVEEPFLEPFLEPFPVS